MNQYLRELSNLLQPVNSGPVFVHSDLLKARYFVPDLRSKSELLGAHDRVLEHAAEGRSIWTPTFNYDFLKTGFTDLRTARCQVGAMGEYRRRQLGALRTSDPVFSVCSTNDQAIGCEAVDHRNAFGEESCFAELYRRDGTVVFYGAPFSSATILHYAELLAGGPVYRYDKLFSGRVIDTSGTENEITYSYHVRPIGRHLDYDWPRLIDDLRTEGVLCELDCEGKVVVRVAGARKLVDFWVHAIKENPFYLLDNGSKQWVLPEYGRLDRRFELSDFE